MIKEKLSGVFVPAITPFTNDEVQFDKLEKNIKKLNETSIRGYLALGSNGENKSLTYGEKLKVLEVFINNKTDNALLKLKNIILTPHSAALTKEGSRRMAIHAAEGVADVLEGKQPKWIFNKNKLKNFIQ
jgi:dihydrodipicolinate synthase/N-acetylneuraminate lyase